MIDIISKQMLFSDEERIIGVVGDSNAVTRVFRIPRVQLDGVDISGLLFRLDLEYLDTETQDEALLEKEITLRDILLTWTITATTAGHIGATCINVRGFDGTGAVRWSSRRAVVYIEDRVKLPNITPNQLTVLEELEAKIENQITKYDGAEAKRQENEQSRQENEQKRQESEQKRQEASDKALNNLNAAKDELKGYATLAKSWAIGGTSIRDGEETDNSKYYAGLSKEYANRADSAAELAGKYADMMYPRFHIDWDTMELVQDVVTEGLLFSLDENKVLSYEIAV